MEILWWLAPTGVVTVLAMGWVGWLGRERQREHREDRDAAVQRMGEALAKQAPTTYAAPKPPRDSSTGVAVRRTWGR